MHGSGFQRRLWPGLLLPLAACASGDPGEPGPWVPPGAGMTSDDSGGTTGGRPGADDLPDPTDGRPGEDTTAGGSTCEPGEVMACMCPDGSEGERECHPSGDGFGACVCDPGGSTDDTTGPGESSSSTTDGPGMAEEVCYPGAANDFTTCVPLHAFEVMPAGYDYPPPYMGDDNYREPVAFIDLEELDPGLYLAPNFRLDEIAQLYKGRYAIVQPHSIVALQELRDTVGAIIVNSGYRSPAYNDTVDGATYSRHMYGDAFDLNPQAVNLDVLEAECTAAGGMLVEYTSHVHCDFRFDPVDEEFFGPAAAAAIAPTPAFDATLVHEDGVWTAPAEGFDEGAPQRRWTARNEQDEIIATAIGQAFVPPPEAVTVEVRVGARLERWADVPPLVHLLAP